jgi:hypothetical protein
LNEVIILLERTRMISGPNWKIWMITSFNYSRIRLHMGSVWPFARSVWGSASSFETSVTAAKLCGLGRTRISLGSTQAVRNIMRQQSDSVALNSFMSSPESSIVWYVVTLLLRTRPQLKHLGGTNRMAAVDPSMCVCVMMVPFRTFFP